jgi:hypothetical protein
MWKVTVMNMNRIIAVALLVGGVVLVILGINATNSFGSDVSRFFTGSPTDKAIWMLIGGIIAAIVGLGLTLRGWKHA